jgi:integrase/recombinase XerD
VALAETISPEAVAGETPSPERGPSGRDPAGRVSREAGAIEPLILDFLAYLELERGLSRNTLSAYRSDLLQLGEFLERRGLASADAGHGELAAFLGELEGTVAPSTLARKIACMRSFYRYLRREEAIAHDPTAELRGPPKPQRLPRVLSREQVARLLGQPSGTDPLARWRCATGRCSS